jgi:hypothetical protein
MNWIEHLIGVSPDAGNGALEVILAAAVATFVVATLTRRYRRRGSAHLRAGRLA